MLLSSTGSNIKYLETQFQFLSDIIESLLFGITVESFEPIESIGSLNESEKNLIFQSITKNKSLMLKHNILLNPNNVFKLNFTEQDKRQKSAKIGKEEKLAKVRKLFELVKKLQYPRNRNKEKIDAKGKNNLGNLKEDKRKQKALANLYKIAGKGWGEDDSMLEEIFVCPQAE